MTAHYTTAPLKNVAAFAEAMQRAVASPPGMPRMVTFHGFSGFGKTVSAIYAANQYQANYVEVGDSWTKHGLCDAILSQLGIESGGTIDKKVAKIIEGLVIHDRPLIIDEFDLLVRKKYLDLVREIHDKSGAAIILIGEEMLPQKLETNERFHNRILDFVPAQPADREDINHLARIYCDGVTIEDDLLKRLHKVSQGRPRRICVSLHRIKEFADLNDLESVSMQQFGEDRLATGLSPKRRAA